MEIGGQFLITWACGVGSPRICLITICPETLAEVGKSTPGKASPCLGHGTPNSHKAHKPRLWLLPSSAMKLRVFGKDSRRAFVLEPASLWVRLGRRPSGVPFGTPHVALTASVTRWV